MKRRSFGCSVLALPKEFCKRMGQFVLGETGWSRVFTTAVVEGYVRPQSKMASRLASSVPLKGLGIVGARK
jgi:hypothetical protein